MIHIVRGFATEFLFIDGVYIYTYIYIYISSIVETGLQHIFPHFSTFLHIFPHFSIPITTFPKQLLQITL